MSKWCFFFSSVGLFLKLLLCQVADGIFLFVFPPSNFRTPWISSGVPHRSGNKCAFMDFFVYFSMSQQMPQDATQGRYELQIVGTGGLEIVSQTLPLTFESQGFVILVQSDKAIYKPGQTSEYM